MVLGLAFEKGFIQKTGTKVFYDGFFLSLPPLPILAFHKTQLLTVMKEPQRLSMSPYRSRARYAITQFCIADVFDPDGKSSLCKI